MFDADRPIVNSSQDRLNRATFSKYLARCMLDHAETDSLVIGLYGGWGVGKTSIINLVLEELNFAANNMEDADKPIILNFSPWSYSGQQQLIYNFFRRLSSTLRNTPYFENRNRIIYLLELYVSFFTQKSIPKALRTPRTWWQKITFQSWESAYGWESGRDLTLIKAELNELLRKQKHKIIIVIDNISRLSPEEIKQTFQIVKSMGDYANTTYLLAFDKEQVIHAINKIDGSGGLNLIEKIVQLPFNVPPILQQDLENIFADRLNEVIALLPQDTWNIEYWADVYYTSLRFFFENCRDITRYVNTLQFSYSRLRDIVNPVDFFALTAIEVFLPTVYSGIRDNKDLFTDLLDNVYVLDKEQMQKEKLRCDEILARNHRVSREILLDLLMKLFPRLRYLYQPFIPFYHSDTLARKLHRICSPDLFDVYFRLSMQISHIPELEFETLLNFAKDNETFDQALTRLTQDGRIIQFLDQLDGKVIQKIPVKNIPAIVDALMDNGDLFPLGICGLISLDTPMRIHRILHSLLRRFENTEERFEILQKAIAKANKSIYIIVHELKEQSREHLESTDTFLPLEFRDLRPAQLESLKKLTVSRIALWAHDGRLQTHPQLIQLLYAWHDWGNNDECMKFLEQMTLSDKGLVIFLVAALTKPIAEIKINQQKTMFGEYYLEDINTLIPIPKLKEHAKLIFEDNYFEKLTEEEQLAIMIFLDLTKTSTTKLIPKTTA